MATKEIAIGKRAAIDKASTKMFLSVCAASIIFGLAIVGSIFFIKWMIFNGNIIARKDKVITDYKETQTNLGLIRTSIIGDEETVPDEADAATSEEEAADDEEKVLPLAQNANLEIMARTTPDPDRRCEDIDGEPVDVSTSIELARICSALRVIPDALPSVLNAAAVYSSLNKLFLLTPDQNGQPTVPKNITPGGLGTVDTTTGLTTIPVTLSIEKNTNVTKGVLSTIERSIRNIDVRTATITWRSNGTGNDDDVLELRGTAVAYHSTPIEATIKSETLYADPDKAKGTTNK